MKKLKLEIEQLEVESFATVAGREGDRGTVRGLAEPRQTEGPQATCFPEPGCPMEYSPHIWSCDPADCATFDCFTPGEATTDLNNQTCAG